MHTDMIANAGWRRQPQGTQPLKSAGASQAILDEELEQLPERYRTPVILCHLESMTRHEAAQHLGISSGSLHGRLERARDLLRHA